MKKWAEVPPRSAVAIGANETNEQQIAPQEIAKAQDHQLGQTVGPTQEHFFE